MPSWSAVLNEIAGEEARGRNALDAVRRKYLKMLSDHTGRNVIAYYSGWLTNLEVSGARIDDADMNGFMEVVHGLDRSKGLDLILHTPGGDIGATEAIVRYLRAMFKEDIRVIVPQLAMSGGTMVACASKGIILGEHSSLGPIDPQMSGIPARGVVEEFERAYNEIKSDPAKYAVWQHILSKYQPTFISQCENAVAWSKSLVKKQLTEVMFKGEEESEEKADKVVAALSDYSENKSHGRHIHADELKDMGLKVIMLESEENRDLQDLTLTVHHAYMHSFANSPALKIIENHEGSAMINSIAQSS